MREYEEWLLGGDVKVALSLLRRVAAQVARTSSFPPPEGFSHWIDEAVDELIVQMIDKKKGVGFLLDALIATDDQGSAERYVVASVGNFLKDQAAATPRGKLRNRLATILGQDGRFTRITEPDEGWRLATHPHQWWQGDPADLERAAFGVRGVFIRSWNTSGPTSRATKEALTGVAVVVLRLAAGIVRAEILARVLLERFRDAIAPETRNAVMLEDVGDAVADQGQEPDEALAQIGAEDLWLGLDLDQRAVVAYLTSPVDAAEALGIGRRTAAARVAQVLEIIKLAVVDDPHAEAVVRTLMELGRLSAGNGQSTEWEVRS